MKFNKNILYTVIAVLAVLSFTNPTTSDFKAEVKNAYNETDGQGQAFIKALGYVGKLQVSRKNYLIFSVYKIQGKSVFGDGDVSYNLGLLGNFLKLEQGNFLTKGKYSESIAINSRNIDDK